MEISATNCLLLAGEVIVIRRLLGKNGVRTKEGGHSWDRPSSPDSLTDPSVLIANPLRCYNKGQSHCPFLLSPAAHCSSGTPCYLRVYFKSINQQLDLPVTARL